MGKDALSVAAIVGVVLFFVQAARIALRVADDFLTRRARKAFSRCHYGAQAAGVERHFLASIDRAADRLDFGVECDRWIRRTITAERLGEREIRRMYAAAIRSKLQQENPLKP